MTYYTAKLSGNKESTPEGYILFRGVAVARTGVMKYLPTETKVAPGPDGFIWINRSPEELFDVESMASLNGKPVTLFHPNGDVNPDNWNYLAKGFVQDARRGEVEQDDLLLADVLVTDADTIAELNEVDDVEVSCGYDSKVSSDEPGKGEVTQIRYNHLALLPGKDSRCGSQCSLTTDSKPEPGEQKPVKKNLIEKIWSAFKARDEAAMTECVGEEPKSEEKKDESPEGEVEESDVDAEQNLEMTAEDKKDQDPITALVARIEALEAFMQSFEDKKDEAPADDKKEDKQDDEPSDEEKKEADEKKEDEEPSDDKKESEDEKKTDSAELLNYAQDVYARAEILSPGIQLPMRDAAGDPAKFRDSLCALKRKALNAAFADSKTRNVVAPMVAGVNIDTLGCEALQATFVGASELVKQANNSAAISFKANDAAPTMNNLLAEMNRRNAEFWSRSN